MRKLDGSRARPRCTSHELIFSPSGATQPERRRGERVMSPVRRAVITLYIDPDSYREQPGHELTPAELRDIALGVNGDAEFIFGYESGTPSSRTSRPGTRRTGQAPADARRPGAQLLAALRSFNEDVAPEVRERVAASRRGRSVSQTPPTSFARTGRAACRSSPNRFSRAVPRSSGRSRSAVPDDGKLIARGQVRLQNVER
jgi:hypothetical protein